MNLQEASKQWRERPDDERFTSLTDLALAARTQRTHSKGLVVPTDSLKAVGYPEEPDVLRITGRDGTPVYPTHWATGQLAARVGAPASYLRTLPSPLAADCINFGIMTREVEDLGVLLRTDEGIPSLTAVTGPTYGRVWNSEVADALHERFGDGVSGAFRVPGIFGKPLDMVTKHDTTLYLGDHDMFVFLADEEHRIEIPNRRDGQPGSLARGFFVRNSEVGAATLSVRTFLFDFVCANRIVWGATETKEISIRHTSGAPRRFVSDVAPALEAYAQSSTQSITDAIFDARHKRIVEPNETDKAARVQAFLAQRFTKAQAQAIAVVHEVEEGRPIETLWDAATAVTAYAREIPYQDERVKIETEGGKILAMAS